MPTRNEIKAAWIVLVNQLRSAGGLSLLPIDDLIENFDSFSDEQIKMCYEMVGAIPIDTTQYNLILKRIDEV